MIKQIQKFLNLQLAMKLSNINDFDDYKSKKINYMPLFNYNLYDGIMPGISFSNSSIIRKPFNYKIVPYFSTKQKEILGKFNLKFTDYNENKNSDLFSVDYFIGGSTFHYKENLSYDTFFPSILFTFRNIVDCANNCEKTPWQKSCGNIPKIVIERICKSSFIR